MNNPIQNVAKIPELQNPDMPQYTVYEYAQPIDSANMTPEHWMRIADDIQKNYADYDGFVVLHGTDTMSYTASALSFILENLAAAKTAGIFCFNLSSPFQFGMTIETCFILYFLQKHF